MIQESNKKIISSNVKDFIINWMRSFTNNGLGFSARSIEIFSALSTNNIESFNKRVMFVVNSLNNIGIEPGIEPDGSLSITPAMLNKLNNPEDFTPELYDFLFDDRLAGIKYDDKDVVAVLTKNFERIKKTEFDDPDTLATFAKYGNFPAVEWYLKTYGYGRLRLLPFTPAVLAFNYLVKFDEMKTIDVFYDFLKDKFDSYTGNDGKLEFNALDLSLEGIKRILPLFQFKGTSKGYVWLFDDFNFEFKKIDKSLFNLLDLSEEEWKNLALIVIKKVDNFAKFDEFRETIKGLNAVSYIFVQTIMTETDWKHHEEYVKTIPDVAEIFLF